ncbi:cytochrome b-c1 complex subunit 7-like protein [Leptotrombidium deliense]|uniref:Cytochrome b-c1 complex subunit 7 n=1 Tax=Leptotrombidium deliense TaxID=299467 RepID=A0A443SP14_9ACAR|nr:cytochrome b-c1 complex subunit 7-like protein [Leptotrombidium deliense]
MVFLSRVTQYMKTPPEEFGTAFQKWYYNLQLYSRYGLYHDDIMLDEEYSPEIQEAVRRLPSDLYDQRTFRLVRACQLEMTKSYLPKEEWITFEADRTKGRYLQPYVDEVLAEWKEREDWERQDH